MDLRWLGVAIAGCAGLALCIAAALLAPMAADQRRVRPLANVGRLTSLPEYVRAMRVRLISTIAVVTLLAVAFAAAVLTGARPSGLPTAAGASASNQPEDIMLCLGGPATDPAVGATLRYFAERVPTFGTQRIGLTTTNRRVIPLTRDYQYVAGALGTFATGADARQLVAPVTYSDYAPDTEDLLALCLSGFPSFDRPSPQRRSVVYVGPGTLHQPGERRPGLFTLDRVTELATTAGARVDAIVTGGAAGNAPSALARDTGGLAFTAGPAVAQDLATISANPPAPTVADTADVATTAVETPNLAIILALLATVALVWYPLVIRR